MGKECFLVEIVDADKKIKDYLRQQYVLTKFNYFYYLYYFLEILLRFIIVE